MARIRQATRKPTPEQQEAIKKVWVKYKAKPTEAMRNELMEFYLPLVRYNAERVHTKLRLGKIKNPDFLQQKQIRTGHGRKKAKIKLKA